MRIYEDCTVRALRFFVPKQVMERVNSLVVEGIYKHLREAGYTDGGIWYFDPVDLDHNTEYPDTRSVDLSWASCDGWVPKKVFEITDIVVSVPDLEM